MEELCAEVQQSTESSGTIGRCASMASSHQKISVSVVREFVRWNEEAVSRCTLFSSQCAAIAANASAVFTCLLDLVSMYITEGLDRAGDSLTEAAALRERFMLGNSGSRRISAAAASTAEAAVAEAMDGAHAASCEELAVPSAEGAACKGLQQCIETVVAEVECVLSPEQKATDYRSPDDSIAPES